MKTTPQQQTIDALLNLLEDEDNHVSTVAMEQLLTLENDVDRLVAENQESSNPVLRNRIHQLGNILKIRRSRSVFIDNVKNSSIGLWDGILQINYQYNPQMRQDDATRMMTSLTGQLPKKLSTLRLAEFMRNKNFTFTGEDMLGADLYLIEDVLLQRVGAPILLSVIAKELGRFRNWRGNIVIYKGRHCLLDPAYNLIEPTDEWRVSRLTTSDRVHSCDKKETWLVILCQLFVSAIVEGRLQAIHRVGSMLAELCGGHRRHLPYPLGH